ncbi:hypothetical protein CCACVL1_19230 [Corchorus capsularis]|uniref:Uncharacterized protein n=1 Tax=Corchorus capsularis TaxID=210143 RepID=A0A1R3HHQ7_COCAP|nr:hypothetical protein CCACVL1_19230 [Corchorus capsularis]
MGYALLELEENLARIKAKAAQIEMERSKMEAMINFVRDQSIVLPEDIYKSMATMKVQYTQFMVEESQLEAMLNFAHQNQSFLEESDANMTSKSVNILVGKQHEAMQHPKVPQFSEASSPPLNTPEPVQKDEKSDEEDEGMALDEGSHTLETTYEDESMEIVRTKDVLVESEDNGVSHEYEDDSSSDTRVEEEHNKEIIEESPPLECENSKMVEEEVDSQAMIENLDCGEANFLGIEALLQPRSHGIPNDKWKLNDYFVKATTSYKGEKEMSTKLAWANTAILSLKRIGHQPITSTTMALATLAIHGVDQDEFGELFPSLFTFQCPYNFLFHSYLIFALKWQDPP